MDNVYAQRKTLRWFEKLWTRIEILVNRFTGSDFNPLYHLGTLAIYLLVVLTVTGIYLTIFYRPGADTAYASVERISGGLIGSLMRSIHRYASDALLLVALIHGLKTFLSDRFWGARWLAWVSGWLLVIVSWVIGTTGYWLIWDLRSQWMTELLINSGDSGIALTFLNPNMASSSFAAFVIVLFIHIFLPLALLLLIILHLLRLTRGRVWSPRWVLILSTLGLSVASLIWPAASEAPADMNSFIESVKLDAWYLGFLPLLDVLGNSGFWLLTLGLFGLVFALPWIARGRQNGPAVIHAADCTGCGLCAAECPYRAIEMHYRDDDSSRFKSIAVINADLCTGCGLCVGTCATLGIELIGMPTETLYDRGLLEAVRRQVEQEIEPVVVFTCQRQAGLGSLPPEMLVETWEQARVSAGAPIYTGEWVREGIRTRTVSCVLPCVGMTDVDWIKELNRSGAKDVLLLACPFDDCNYREGPQWEAARLRRRKGILAPNIQWRENAPGDPRAVPEMLAITMKTAGEKTRPELPDPRGRSRMRPSLPVAGVILAFFSLLAALALPVDFPSRSALAGQSQVRVLFKHTGVIAEVLGTGSVTLPDTATIELAQIMGGTRFPVGLQVWVDGELLSEEFFKAAGARNEGEIGGMAVNTLPPGNYALELRIDDDGEGWRTAFQGDVTLEPSRILTLIYDEEEDIFRVSQIP